MNWANFLSKKPVIKQTIELNLKKFAKLHFDQYQLSELNLKEWLSSS